MLLGELDYATNIFTRDQVGVGFVHLVEPFIAISNYGLVDLFIHRQVWTLPAVNLVQHGSK